MGSVILTYYSLFPCPNSNVLVGPTKIMIQGYNSTLLPPFPPFYLCYFKILPHLQKVTYNVVILRNSCNSREGLRAVLPLAFNFSAYFSSEIDPLEERFQYAILGNTLSVHTIIAHYNSGSHLPVCFLSLHVEMRLHCYFWID